MVQTVQSWQSIIEQVIETHPDLSRYSHQFKQEVARKIEGLNLSSTQIRQMAINMGFKLFPKPKNIPENWLTTFCKSHLCEKYIDPITNQWIAIRPPDSRLGGVPWVIHRTATGYADARWFYEVFPQLASLFNDPTLGIPFSRKFNENINKKFGKNGMTRGQIAAINLFFEKYVPGLESICSTCYKVMLPITGAGERWLHQASDGTEYEVRLSAAKPLGLPGQDVEYVTQTITGKNKKSKFAMWDPLKCQMDYTDNMKQEPTHIPWDIYDYNKFNVDMPLCLCRGK